jgi:hypothetical protein
MYYLEHPVCAKGPLLQTADLKASLFDAKTKNMVTTGTGSGVYPVAPGLLLGGRWSPQFLEILMSSSPI